MHIFRFAWVFAIIILPIVSLAQINKCEVNGRIVYQQEVCARAGGTGGELKVVVPSTESGAYNSPELEKLRRDYLEAQKEMDGAVAKHCSGKRLEKLLIGMDEADMYCIPAYRTPEKTNITTTASGESKQYIFRRGSSTTYVYSKNGRIDAIQSDR